MTHVRTLSSDSSARRATFSFWHASTCREHVFQGNIPKEVDQSTPSVRHAGLLLCTTPPGVRGTCGRSYGRMAHLAGEGHERLLQRGHIKGEEVLHAAIADAQLVIELAEHVRHGVETVPPCASRGSHAALWGIRPPRRQRWQASPGLCADAAAIASS